MCPVCKQGRETSAHFLECKMYGVQIQECQAQVAKTCQKHKVDPYLRYLIQLIVRGESCTVSNITADNPLFPVEDYKLVIDQQAAIGWQNFKRGYVSLAWDQHQQRYIGQTKQATRNTVTWLANIILDIQEHVYQRWLYRNDCLHKTGDDATKTLLLARIRGLYKKG